MSWSATARQGWLPGAGWGCPRRRTGRQTPACQLPAYPAAGHWVWAMASDPRRCEVRDKRGVWRVPADRGAPAAWEGVEAAAPLPRRRGHLRGVVHRREEAGPRAVYQQVSQVPGGPVWVALCASSAPVNGPCVAGPAGRSASLPLSTVPILQLGRGRVPPPPPALCPVPPSDVRAEGAACGCTPGPSADLALPPRSAPSSFRERSRSQLLLPTSHPGLSAELLGTHWLRTNAAYTCSCRRRPSTGTTFLGRCASRSPCRHLPSTFLLK